MSYLAIDEIRGKTSGTPTDVNDLKYQLATAWVNFNGTGTVAIRDSYNVSSITDNGTGNYTVNFVTALSNADYSWSWQGRDGGNISFISGANFSQTASSLRLSTASWTGNSGATGIIADTDPVSVQIFGGLN